ncbi:MAG TPA: hypothetical protein VGC18_00600 [Lacisediminihabitans sp.]|uniref:hypothetical protein n=1 Tax=Lacisediminihabitans sp. TaxID=2787631 RepID=UPI002ED783F2
MTIATTDAVHGRTEIASRALRRLISTITAETMGVAAHQVGVELSDDNGLLGVTASTPVRVRSLATAHPDDEHSLLDRAASAQTIIRDRMLELAGSSVGFVRLRLTGAEIRAEARVR